VQLRIAVIADPLELDPAPGRQSGRVAQLRQLVGSSTRQAARAATCSSSICGTRTPGASRRRSLDADRQLDGIRHVGPAFAAATVGMLGKRRSRLSAGDASSRAAFTSSTTSFAAGGATITADVANNALRSWRPNRSTTISVNHRKLDVARGGPSAAFRGLGRQVSRVQHRWQALSGIDSFANHVIVAPTTPPGSGSSIIDISPSAR
jgi:hypothetical protein